MTTRAIRFPTLLSEIWATPGWLGRLLLVGLGVALLTVSAKIHVPFYPVPMTMQTLAVLGLGMVYGWKLGGITVAAYLLAGAMGAPVFSGTPEKGIGLAYMVGPTGGYLLGFFLAAVIAGFLSERGWDRNMVSTFAAMLIGNVMIYIPGLIWLGNLVGWDNPVLEWGMTPFLYGDLLKILLATLLLPGIWKLVRQKK